MSRKQKQWRELPSRQIARALEGNRRDLDTLVRWYGPVVWGAVAARVRGVRGLALQMEDLVGDVWLELCRNGMKRLRYYDQDRGEFGYFIRMQAAQIAWSLVLAHRRRPELVPYEDSEQANDWVEPRLINCDLLERLARAARARLGDGDWALFQAAYVEEHSAEEVAALLNKKVRTVYQQKYRLRVKLEAIARELMDAGHQGRAPSDASVEFVVACLLLLTPRLHGDARHSVDPLATRVDDSGINLL